MYNFNLIRKLAFFCGFFGIFTVALFTAGCDSSKSTTQTKHIGIIVPIEHKAMDEIVAGFTETLTKNVKDKLTFKVANAQADLNLERSIVAQMKSENYDLIIPIGTGATQMTAAMIKEQPIVSLASDFSDADRQKRNPCNIAVVHDEISPEQSIAFIHQVYPQLKHLVLIHSTQDKVFPEIEATKKAAKTAGIELKTMMMPTLNDLYSIANNIPQDAEAIFVLKDTYVVSGIATLVHAAEKHHIPLITSDQGSVQDGAAFALGVHERQIGVEGGKLAAAILAGKAACTLPIVEMKKLTVFINQASLNKENQLVKPIENAATSAKYTLEHSGKDK